MDVYFPYLLSLFWIASTLAILFKPLAPFLDILLTYGKLAHQTDAYGFPPAFVWPAFYATGAALSFSLPHTSLALILFRFHTLRRLLECAFIHRFSSSRRIPLHQVAAGLLFYVSTPFTIHIGSTAPNLSKLVILLFGIASMVQMLSHRALAKAPPTVGKYGIPTSPLFYRIVCPHYLAEIVIYVLLASLCGTVMAWLMCAFVVVNLCDTAQRTSCWYQRTFPQNILPQSKRWAVIPFVL